MKLKIKIFASNTTTGKPRRDEIRTNFELQLHNATRSFEFVRAHKRCRYLFPRALFKNKQNAEPRMW